MPTQLSSSEIGENGIIKFGNQIMRERVKKLKIHFRRTETWNFYLFPLDGRNQCGEIKKDILLFLHLWIFSFYFFHPKIPPYLQFSSFLQQIPYSYTIKEIEIYIYSNFTLDFYTYIYSLSNYRGKRESPYRLLFISHQKKWKEITSSILFSQRTFFL